MGDVGEDMKAFREFKKEQKLLRKEQNLKILDESGIEYRFDECSYCALIRIPGKPKVNFFTTTGRWVDVKEKFTHRGGAKAFIKWFKDRQIIY